MCLCLPFQICRMLQFSPLISEENHLWPRPRSYLAHSQIHFFLPRRIIDHCETIRHRRMLATSGVGFCLCEQTDIKLCELLRGAGLGDLCNSAHPVTSLQRSARATHMPANTTPTSSPPSRLLYSILQIRRLPILLPSNRVPIHGPRVQGSP